MAPCLQDLQNGWAKNGVHHATAVYQIQWYMWNRYIESTSYFYLYTVWLFCRKWHPLFSGLGCFQKIFTSLISKILYFSMEIICDVEKKTLHIPLAWLIVLLSASCQAVGYVMSVCFLQGHLDASMYSQKQILRASELKAPFIQCAQFFHIITITELHCKPPAPLIINPSRLRQNCLHFALDIFKNMSFIMKIVVLWFELLWSLFLRSNWQQVSNTLNSIEQDGWHYMALIDHRAPIQYKDDILPI